MAIVVILIIFLIMTAVPVIGVFVALHVQHASATLKESISNDKMKTCTSQQDSDAFTGCSQKYTPFILFP